MSHPILATLYRIGAAAGCGSAVILLINAAKRAEVTRPPPLPSWSPHSHRSWRWPSSPPFTSPFGRYLACGRRAGPSAWSPYS
jgi:hypothetical protein